MPPKKKDVKKDEDEDDTESDSYDEDGVPRRKSVLPPQAPLTDAQRRLRNSAFIYHRRRGEAARQNAPVREHQPFSDSSLDVSDYSDEDQSNYKDRRIDTATETEGRQPRGNAARKQRAHPYHAENDEDRFLDKQRRVDESNIRPGFRWHAQQQQWIADTNPAPDQQRVAAAAPPSQQQQQQRTEQQRNDDELSVPTPTQSTPRGPGRRKAFASVSQSSTSSSSDVTVSVDGTPRRGSAWVATIWRPLTPEIRRRIQQLVNEGQIRFFHGRLQQSPRAGPNNVTGGRHWQCYIEFPKKVTAINIRDMLDIKDYIYLQLRHGSADDAIKYIDNSTTNIAKDVNAGSNDKDGRPNADNDIESFTVGTRAPAGAGDAWTQIRDAVQAGGTFEDIVDSHFRFAVQYPTGINKVIAAKTKAKPRDVKCYCFWGDTGTGKTTLVYEKFGDETYRKLAGQWWDGYEAQDTIFFDDYYGSEYGLTFDYLLQVADRHPLTVNIRNGTRAAQWTNVVFTSNHHPYTWFPKVSEAKMNAFKRRLPESNIIKVEPWQDREAKKKKASESLVRTSSTLSTAVHPYETEDEPQPASPGVGMLKRENAFSSASEMGLLEL